VSSLLVLGGGFSLGQPSILWERAIDVSPSDEARSVLEVNGGFVIGGTTKFGPWLARVDENGDTVWNRYYGEADLRFLLETADGFFLGGSGGGDAYLVRTDENGIHLWTRQYGGPEAEYANGSCESYDGGFVVVGQTDSYGKGAGDVWLLKVDSGGDTLWTRAFGGVGNDGGATVRQASNGGYIVAAWTESFGSGSSDMWIIMTDENGNMMWTRTYGGPAWDIGWDIETTDDGGYVVSGVFDGSAWLVRLDMSGDTLWTRRYGWGLYDEARAVAEATNGGYIMFGETFRGGLAQALVIRTDENGDSLWTLTTGGNGVDNFRSGKTTSDGGYVAVGATSSFSPSGLDAYVVRFAPDPSSGVRGSSVVPGSFSLLQNYPNPFNPSTVIRYGLPERSHVKLEIFNPLGQRVAVLVDGEKEAGYHSVTLESRGLASGLYLYRLQAGDFVETKKLIILR
jgi:hypothetical protein